MVIEDNVDIKLAYSSVCATLNIRNGRKLSWKCIFIINVIATLNFNE